MRSLSRFVGWGGMALLMLSFATCLLGGADDDFWSILGALGLIAIFLGVFLRE